MGLLYSRYKIFHFQEKIDSLSRENSKILPPIHIRLKPTNICNHNCSYCAYRVDNLQLGKDMKKRDSIPREKMFEIVADMIEMGVKAVTLSGGGEPLCYAHLDEMLKKMADSPLKIAALTNGAKLTGRVAEFFAHRGTWVRVSMDGWDDASYIRYRGVKDGEYTRIIGNLRNFKKLKGACYLGVSIIVDKDNYKHLVAMIGRLQDIGVDSVKVSPCIVSNTSAANNRYHGRFFDKAKTAIRKAQKLYQDGTFEIYDCYHRQEISFEKSYTWCPYLQILPVIGADQNVYSCQDKAYNLDSGLIGSLRDVRFKDFWFSDKNKFFRIDPSQDCSHHCVANGKNLMVHEYLNADKEHLHFV